MTLALDDTIAAIATAPGGGLRGIVRLSGMRSVEVVGKCLADDTAAPGLQVVLVPTVLCATLKLDGIASPLPCELYIWPNERSYTRQPVVEIHTIGSPPLLDAVLRAVCAGGARLAGPGEFTLRAFLSGRLDLAQAEAVLAVIDAQDRRTLDVALTQLAGGLSQPLGKLRDSLLDLLADLEAGLDFVDEDIEFVSAAEVAARLASATNDADEIARQLGTRSERTRLPRVVLVGPPNAGKSSLFNVLCGRDAIVSPIAGTTRDALTAQVTFGDIACELVDTAGIEVGDKCGDKVSSSPQDASRSIDQLAQLQTHAQLGDADVELWCIDAAELWLEEAAGKLDKVQSPPELHVVTKVDLVEPPIANQLIANNRTVLTSSTTGAGIDELRTAIATHVAATLHAESSVVASTAVRCQESLRLAIEALSKAHHLTVARGGDELVAAEIRLALAELGKIVGVVYTDDILDRLFGRFCIGK